MSIILDKDCSSPYQKIKMISEVDVNCRSRSCMRFELIHDFFVLPE